MMCIPASSSYKCWESQTPQNFLHYSEALLYYFTLLRIKLMTFGSINFFLPRMFLMSRWDDPDDFSTKSICIPREGGKKYKLSSTN